MTSTPRRAATVALTTAGILFHLVILAIIFFSTLLAPPWAVVVGSVVWLGSVAPFVWAFRSRPRAMPLISLAVLAAWIAFLTFGDLALGWTA